MSNTLSWHNLNYSIKKKNLTVKWDPFRIGRETNVRRILNNVSGQIRTGDMVAIIGSSGAGKSSLMAALCGRIRGKIKGTFYVNDLPAKKNLINSVTGFVPQFEVAAVVLTVLEHLRFVAQLKLGRDMPLWEKWDRVDSVIHRLGMTNLMYTRIKHLSGGERKKLNLAEELMREPLFLFTDEPTTGLDSYNSKSVMQSLRALTGNDGDEDSTKRAVICSIHQPSSEVFNYFNFIILMDTGSVVYHGRISDCYVHLEKINLSVPVNYNPAEFFVNIVSPIEFRGLQHADRITQLSELNELNLTEERANAAGKPKLSATDIEEVGRLDWCTQFLLLLQRASMIGCRDLGETILHSSSYLFIAMGIGILYAGDSPNQQVLITDAEGMFFNAIAQIYFGTYMNVVSVFAPELPSVRKETGENLYCMSSYYAMKFISMLPKILIECFVASILIYFLCSFTRGSGTFLPITITIVLLGFTSASYGFMWACLMADGMGLEISSPVDLYQMLSSGIYGAGTIPFVMRYFSLFFFFIEALSYQYWSKVDTLQCVPDLPCLQTGSEVLEKYNYGHFAESTVAFDYACILGWCVVFHVIGFFSLRRVVRKEGFY